jgi:hypothetical protein
MDALSLFLLGGSGGIERVQELLALVAAELFEQVGQLAGMQRVQGVRGIPQPLPAQPTLGVAERLDGRPTRSG